MSPTLSAEPALSCRAAPASRCVVAALPRCDADSARVLWPFSAPSCDSSSIGSSRIACCVWVCVPALCVPSPLGLQALKASIDTANTALGRVGWSAAVRALLEWGDDAHGVVEDIG
uniref:Uncharacterized protein n=1 Tax=Mycena chlorophos TaxID=658473 RepID=A0ABQ0KXD6_MYCCL|nr:predicted protein [Mycena chlorophos]